jgi:hypothetical protein
MPVTPQFVLEGAAYALEQCGLLLRDAKPVGRPLLGTIASGWRHRMNGIWKRRQPERSQILVRRP